MAYRREVQAVFQDPFAVFNPFYTVDHLLTVPIKQFKLAKSGRERATKMDEALTAVGLRPEDVLGRFPHQLSGGQRQRINVARALLLKPRLLIADEPVSMVDASLRANILESLRNLHRDHGVSIIYITHDLTTAYHVANSIIVLYRGDVVETGDVEIGDPQPAAPLYAAAGRLDPVAQPRPEMGPARRSGRPTKVVRAQPRSSTRRASAVRRRHPLRIRLRSPVQPIRRAPRSSAPYHIVRDSYRCSRSPNSSARSPHRSGSWRKQCGVDLAVAGLPFDTLQAGERVGDLAPLQRMKDDYESGGFELRVIESRPPLNKAKRGLEGRDEEIDVVCDLLDQHGQARHPGLVLRVDDRLQLGPHQHGDAVARRLGGDQLRRQRRA